ncbi:MAG: hypothetical protein OXE76_11215 [Alphaproteobacteria bacterium]|nr:hypothetical protein [Alphaproteobacteria bacterium]
MMKITRINIESQETGEGSPFDMEVARIDAEWQGKPKRRAEHSIDCNIDIELEIGESVAFTVTVPYSSGMTLSKQWENIIKEAKVSLEKATNSLPSTNLSQYVDLVEASTKS